MSSSSFSTKPQWIYDVFINFRGGDTRRNFVSHLYYALSNAGVNTFFDEENLLKGMQLEELSRAIEGSQIAIAASSETYTESSWCLSEPTGHFGDALEAAAQKKYSAKDREYGFSRWKIALAKAANFSGWDVKNHRYMYINLYFVVSFLLLYVI